SLQMDIFPTNIIDNMMVSKNFTADLPADFTGGLMNISTKDFPDRKIFSVSAGMDYNPQIHFNPDFLTYEGGDTDFLGFDDGTRALPDGARSNNIPTPISGASTEEVRDFISSFNPVLGASRQNSLLDLSASISVGNQINLKSQKENAPKLGYVLSLSYKSDYKYYDDVIYGEYQRFIDPEKYDMEYATIQNGEIGERNILVGLLGGLAYKTNYSKIRLTALRLQSGENHAGKFSIDNNGEAVGQSGYIANSDILVYNQRSITNVLFNGTHRYKNSGWEIDWRISPTFSSVDDPDIRKTAFTINSLDTAFDAGAGGNPSRIWRSLNEINIPARLDLSRKYSFNNRDAKLKFGVSHTYKQRDYEILYFDIQFFGSQSWKNPTPDIVLNPENLYPNRPNSIYYQSGNPDPNPNAYESNINNTGLYISNEINVFDKLKTILGLRAENFLQRHTGRDQTYASGDTQNGKNLENEKVLESLDFFPSVNLIYSLTENQNVRASYSQTIARGSFKEISYAQILDPISNRIFNGSLYTYKNWDGILKATNIENFDFRWELFMPGAQIFSVSAFYKSFTNPIELVRIPEQQTSTEYQPRNVGNGELYGIELEFRKNFDYISSSLKDLVLSGNFAYIESRIDMTEAEYNSRKSFEKTGETINDNRVMAGQAPYLINMGLSYNNDDIGMDAGLFYNVKGPVLHIVGGGLFPDIYHLPFNSLNFSLSKVVGDKLNIEFKISNVLNDLSEYVYKSYNAKDEPFEKYSPGRSFGLGLSYKLH
ncbi:MAG: TonB-dependent receptor domain-containing protein, partial [Bacteroidota bacterium]